MSTPEIARTSPVAMVQLSVMMFLQFFVWGAWYVTLGPYMGKAGMGDSIRHAYTVGPIAAIVSPFFLGIIADRFFSAQRVLGVLHVLGGAALIAAPRLLPAAGAEVVPDAVVQPSHQPFLACLLFHMLCYMPTLGLSNSVAFTHIRSPEKEFPVVRVLGTIGWIVAGFAVAAVITDEAPGRFFEVAGAAGILLGLFSFMLPHTPPASKGKEIRVSEILGLGTLKLLKVRNFAVFAIASFLLCIPLAGYYGFAPTFAGHAGVKNVPVTMTFGQMSEIVFMLLMPLFFARLGVKWMLLVGMLAWVARYVLFAQASDTGVAWMVLAGIILHGICYDFFFVTGFIYVDRAAPKELRSQAQGFLVLLTQGLGLGIGAQVFGRLVANNTAENAAALQAEGEALRKVGTDAAFAEGTAKFLASVDWAKVWMAPAIAAGAIAVLFFLMFWEKKEQRQG